MPDMTKPWAYIEKEAQQMEAKARVAEKEIIKLNGIQQTCKEQAESLRWAIEQQQRADSERAV